MQGINNKGADVKICSTINTRPTFISISLSFGSRGFLLVINSGASWGNERKPDIIDVKYNKVLSPMDLEKIFLILLSTGLFNSDITGNTINWQQYVKQHTENPVNTFKLNLTN